MESASKDVLFTIALNLELPDLLRWCVSKSKINQDVCNNEHVWRTKLLQDYPNYEDIGDEDYLSFISSLSLRETYVFIYQLYYIRKLLNKEETLNDIFLKKVLHLSKRGLDKVPAFNLPNLKELLLDGNKLKKVPSFNLPNLTHLYLNHNQLTEIPSFNLPNLRYLYLNNNRLTKIPAFNLPTLQILYLSENKLTELPDFNLPHLGTLELTNNKLTELPDFNFPFLNHLIVRKNNLTKEARRKLIEKYKKKVQII